MKKKNSPPGGRDVRQNHGAGKDGGDLTSARSAEDALRLCEEKLSLFFDKSQVALSIYSLDRGVYLAVNRSFLRHTGFSRAEIVDRPEITMWVDQEEKQRFIHELLTTGRVEGMEFRYRKKSGETGFSLAFGTVLELEGERCILGENYDITREKLLEETALEKERILRTLTETLPGFLYSFQLRADGGEAFCFVSAGIRDTYGLEAGAVLADISMLRNIMVRSDLHHFREAMLESARTGEMFCQEFRILHPLKGERWLESRSAPEAKPDGSTIWHGITLDVTDRRTYQLQAELVESAVQRSREAMYVMRPDEGFRLVFVNRAACLMTGYSPEMLMDSTIFDLDPEFLSAGAEALRVSALSDRYVCFESVHRCLDGTLLPVEINVYDIGFKGDVLFVALARDISLRKKAEKDLVRKEQTFRALADSSPDVIVRYDWNLRRIFVNPAFEEINSVPASQVLGKTPVEHSTRIAHIADRYEARLRKVLATGEDSRFEIDWHNDAGRMVTFDLRAVAEREGSEVAGVLIFAREVTEQKAKADELNKLNRALRMLSGCNMLLTQAQNELDLLEGICRLVVETGGYAIGWIGYLCGNETAKVRPVAHCGLPETVWRKMRSGRDGGKRVGLVDFGVRAGEHFAGVHAEAGPEARALHEVLQLPGVSSISLLLKNGSELLGTLNIHTDEPGGFGTEEVRLLEELADNVSFGINLIRLREERRQMEEWMRMKEREFRTLVENSPDTIARYDRTCSRIYANRAFGRLAGMEPEALLGRKPTDYNPTPEGAAYEALLAKVIREREPCETEYTWPDARGNLITSHIRIVPEHDEGGRVVSVLAVGRDITRLREAQRQLEYIASYDILTGLPNRQTMREYTNRAIASARRHAGKVALLFVDLDNFKAVNDSLGHDIGDLMLKAVAERILSCVREIDTVGRQGGDEFVIMLTEVESVDEVGGIIARISRQFEQPLCLDDHSLYCSMSIGIALYPDDGDGFDVLMKMADTAMYEAKAAGRNTFSFFTEQMNRSTLEHLRMHGDLKRALGSNELLLHFQPQIGLACGRILGAEALLRWRHPEMGLIPPAQFIPVTEANGLIVPIGEWVLLEACRQAVRWQDVCGYPLKVAVNISAIQFKSGKLEAALHSALEISGLCPECLELELTESILLHNVEQTLTMIKRFKDQGIRISIDDFGTGYSSLAYLKRFSADIIKIDRSFIRKLACDPDTAAIVRAIIQMARSLGITTIAEGVEDQETLKLLKGLECDMIQGFIFSRPLDEIAFEAFCREYTPFPCS